MLQRKRIIIDQHQGVKNKIAVYHSEGFVEPLNHLVFGIYILMWF